MFEEPKNEKASPENLEAPNLNNEEPVVSPNPFFTIPVEEPIVSSETLSDAMPVIGVAESATEPPEIETSVPSSEPALDLGAELQDPAPSIDLEHEDTQVAPPAPSPTFGPIVPSDVAAAAAVNASVQKKKSKKPLIIGIVIIAFLAIMGGSAAFAYTVYQNPQKVVTDALVSAISAKSATYTGTVTIDTKDVKVKVDLKAKANETAGDLDSTLTITSGGKDYTLDASVLTDGTGDLYFKASNLDSLIATVKTALPTVPAATIDSLVAKINGIWIKVSADELKTYNADVATSETCISTELKKFNSDSNAQKEISALYQKNQFIVIDKSLGTKDGSTGYSIKADKTITKSFVDGLKSTKLYTDLHNCDNSFTIDNSLFDTSTQSGNSNFEIWANTWSHQLTKVVIAGDSDGTSLNATFLPTFNQQVTVSTPTSSTTLTQLQSDLTSIIQSVYLNQ
jgi:hypothetical protein